jgi:hypothetical protein
VQATINVSGQTFNALVIENFILRQPSSVKEVSRSRLLLSIRHMQMQLVEEHAY